jgi:ABC-2 type transport system permease protein
VRIAAMNKRGGQTMAPPVDARMRVWYNSSLESKNYVVPGLIAVILQIIAALLTSLTIAREWEMGTMEQILSTPLRPAEMVLGKMLAYFAVGVVDSAIAVFVALFVFEVPFRGSVLLLTVSVCVFLFGALCWGIFVSAAAKTQVQAYQMGILSSFLPAFLLSGFIYSIENMPWVIQVITHIVPARYVVTILKGVFLKGTGLSVLWGELGFLLMYGAIVFALATRKLNRKRYVGTDSSHSSQRVHSGAARAAHAGAALHSADHATADLRLRREPGRGPRPHRVDGHGRHPRQPGVARPLHRVAPL